VTRTSLPFSRILDRSYPREGPKIAPGNEVDDRGELSGLERESVLEIALLMATANGSTSPEELASLADLVGHLEGTKPLPGALSTRLRSIELRGLGGTVEERVRAIAKTLRRALARELAYKAAYAIRVSDLESNPDEEDLADLLVEALELDEVVPDLENEVNEALMTAR
jgi:tellurite resistance protein